MSTVSIIFGRFNPPHKGHKAAWISASQADEWYVGTNPRTKGPKNPLPYDIKTKIMETMYPEIAGHLLPITSWLHLASFVYEKHGDVTLNCITDEPWVIDTLTRYNRIVSYHGFFSFSEITHEKSLRLSSATSLRNAVAEQNREQFSNAAGIPADTLIDNVSFFDLVATYSGFKYETIQNNNK